jgi:hypothetical protein
MIGDIVRESYRFPVVCSLALLLGCGQSGGLTGSVSYNGQPVERGSIAFSPVDGKGPVFGGKIENGKFDIPTAHAGKKRAVVRGIREGVVPQSREEADAAAKAGTFKLPDYIAEDAAGNSQEVDVSGGGQTLDFAITGPPRD